MSDERSARIIESLKHQGVVSLQGLEKLMHAFEKKGKDQTLVKKLQELKHSSTTLTSYKQLKLHLSEAVLARITKDIFDWESADKD